MRRQVDVFSVSLTKLEWRRVIGALSIHPELCMYADCQTCAMAEELIQTIVDDLPGDVQDSIYE